LKRKYKEASLWFAVKLHDGIGQTLFGLPDDPARL
jgi:hypothetical protein